MRKIVSTLGLGRYNQTTKGYEYERVRYCWGEREFNTTLIQEAWGEWFSDAQVLATERARQERRDDLERHPHWKLVDIPDGKNESEFWDIYGQVVTHLEEGDEVILDITHGFRSLPVLILLAATFLRSAWGVTVKHVLYGAHEAKTGDQTPVFDLAPFLTMLDWAGATDRFLDTGDVRRLAQLSRAFSEDLEDSVRHLQAFSTALQLHYPLQAGQAAREGLEALEQSRSRIPAPMGILEKRLMDGISPLAFSDHDPHERQLSALFHQVLWYRRHGHYEKAVGLASEWVHLFVKWKVGQDIWSENFSLKDELGRRRNEDWADKLKNLHEEIKRLRNNISHWQFKRKSELHPSESEDTPRQVEELIKRLETLVRSTGLNLEEPA